MSERQFDQAAAAAARCTELRESGHVMSCERTLRIDHEQATLERSLTAEEGV